MLHPLVSIFGDSSSGIGALGVNGQAFLIQLITFIIVFLILRKWAFKPIVRVLNSRRELIDSGVKLGEEMKKEREQLEKQVVSELHEARVEADKLIGAAQQEARELLKVAEQEAQTKTQKIIDAADEKIKRDTIQARKRLEKDIAGLVSEATEAIIQKKLDAKTDGELIDRYIKQSEAA